MILIIIVLGGELDIATAPGLAGQLEPLAETGSHLILDLAGMRFCDCAGLSLFLRLKQRSAAAGGSLYLTAPTAPVRRLVALTGLHDLLPAAAGPAEVIALPVTPFLRPRSRVPMTPTSRSSRTSARAPPVRQARSCDPLHRADPAGHERTRTATPGASGENRETA